MARAPKTVVAPALVIAPKGATVEAVTTHTEVPPAVTAAAFARNHITKIKATADPLWNTRRRRLDASLVTSLALSLYSMHIGTEMAAIVVPPAFIFAMGIIGAYMGFAEWGRINGVVANSQEEK